MSEKEKILILTAGGSPEPLIYSINFIQPQKIVFLPSPQTFHECAKVLSSMEWENDMPFKGELSDLVKIFDEESEMFLEDYNKSKSDDEKIKYLSPRDIQSLDSYNEIHDFLSKIMVNILEDKDKSNNSLCYAIIPDAELLDESYRISKDVFSKFKNEDLYEVIVDFTGGTKTMGAGVTLAEVTGNYSNFELRYVGSKDSESRNKNGVGIIKDGSEFSKFQENPFTKFATLEFNRGKQFFNTYQFKAAVANFSLAEEKTDDENLEKLAGFYKKIVKFYDSWDKFNNDFEDWEDKQNSKKGKLTRYFKFNIENDLENDEYISKKIKENPEFYNKLLENIEFLNLKISIKNKNYKKDIEYYLPDLLNNAKRRIDERKFDDAVARLYRAMELIAQLNLKDLDILFDRELRKRTFFIDRNKFILESNKRLVDISDVKTWPNYKECVEKNLLYFKVASHKSFELLKIFENDLAKEYLNDKNISNLISNRNKSILAHGLVPMGEDDAKDLYEAVLYYARKYNPNIDDLMELSKFPKFDVK